MRLRTAFLFASNVSGMASAEQRNVKPISGRAGAGRLPNQKKLTRRLGPLHLRLWPRRRRKSGLGQVNEAADGSKSSEPARPPVFLCSEVSLRRTCYPELDDDRVRFSIRVVQERIADDSEGRPLRKVANGALRHVERYTNWVFRLRPRHHMFDTRLIASNHDERQKRLAGFRFGQSKLQSASHNSARCVRDFGHLRGHNGSAFNGRPGAAPRWNHKDRSAGPVQCKEPMQSRRRSAKIGGVPYHRRIAWDA
jgi:hypothetical protein